MHDARYNSKASSRFFSHFRHRDKVGCTERVFKRIEALEKGAHSLYMRGVEVALVASSIV